MYKPNGSKINPLFHKRKLKCYRKYCKKFNIAM